ncbi:MAG: hypothetical protein QXG39_04830 [Candidatus Aenigmatarchaeota archaeon]
MAMAIEISKEDLLKGIATTQVQTSSGSDTFSRIIELLNNPAIQQILLRIFNRIFPETSHSNPTVQQSQQSQQLNGSVIFDAILNFIDGYATTNPQMTLAEFKEELAKNREKIIQIIDTFLKR